MSFCCLNLYKDSRGRGRGYFGRGGRRRFTRSENQETKGKDDNEGRQFCVFGVEFFTQLQAGRMRILRPGFLVS